MDSHNTYRLKEEAIALLKQLIATPSFSREEDKSASLIEQFLQRAGVTTYRYLNNVWAHNKFFDASKPTVLLNSHHDTVKPNKGYTLDPFNPMEKDGKLFGPGSNDAGAALVSLIAAFIFFYDKQDLRYNVVLAATGEEEISGKNGIEGLIHSPEFRDLATANGQAPFSGWCGIVGEPTLLEMAIAEKGLLVFDCVAHGKAGHAARMEGENAIYKAIRDIEWLRTYAFPKVSPLLGPVKLTVTSIETENKAHNVVPSQCNFVLDVRVNELYSLEEVVEIIQSHMQSDARARSLRIRSTLIPQDHPLVKAGANLGKGYYGSPTTSDKALLPFPALKIGPGDSARSHTADEYVYIHEIAEGIEFYFALINALQTDQPLF